jgi:hypothetical protein
MNWRPVPRLSVSSVKSVVVLSTFVQSETTTDNPDVTDTFDAAPTGMNCDGYAFVQA